jgi:hypothetical protein
MATTKPQTEDINWDSVDQSAQDTVSLQLPLVLWRHGKTALRQLGEKNLNYTGGFFFSREAAGADTKIEHWVDASFEGDKGEVLGLGASIANIALVRARKRWFREGDGRTEFRAWKNYEPGFRGHVQVVGFIYGFENPVTFSFKGLLGQAIEAIQREHVSKVVSLVNRTSPTKGRGLPPYAIWLKIQSGKHEKVGSGREQSEVTMPVIWLPKVVDLAFAKTRFVGNPNLQRFQELYAEAADWVREWDYSGPASMDARSDSQARRDALKTPEEIAATAPDADDLPF